LEGEIFSILKENNTWILDITRKDNCVFGKSLRQENLPLEAMEEKSPKKATLARKKSDNGTDAEGGGKKKAEKKEVPNEPQGKKLLSHEQCLGSTYL
jgi:hypothetical protein